MKRVCRLAALAAVLAALAPAQAQVRTPRIGYVYPAGGCQGRTFQVLVAGQYLDNVKEAFISGGGLQVKVVDRFQPLTQKEAGELRDKLMELAKGGKRDAETLKQLADLRKRLATFDRKANPALAESVTLEVTASADAEPGKREVRLFSPQGLSNPLAFCIGLLPETSEKPSRGSEPVGSPKPFKFGRTPDADTGASPTDPAVDVTLPATINGQIMPGDVDFYRFKARRGQRLVVAASARELIPYLPDGVPGWFQATLALYDASGGRIAYVDDFRFNPDPVLFCEIPRDGQYVVEIRDAIYRGREDFVYRIAIGELPYVTGVFPLGCQAGSSTTVSLQGWNLPVTSLQPDTVLPGLHLLTVRSGKQASNAVPFAVDALPDAAEQEPNDQADKAQVAALPVVLNGRIGRPGDRDVFRLAGKAGDKIVAEVLARRLGSPLDSSLALIDPAGKQIAFNDDYEDKGAGLTTHHADSYLAATLPADGTYTLHLVDVQGKGGPEYAYRLRISRPRPDFELRMAPASLNVRGGATVPLTVYALRRDGCSAPITISLKNPPPGFKLSGEVIPGNQDQVKLTLTVPGTDQKEPASLVLEGRATLEGREVIRRVVPAEDMMQAFAYRHLVPAQELKVAVSSRFASKASIQLLSPMPLKLPAGGTATLSVGYPRTKFFPRLDLELTDPPDGITIKRTGPGAEGMDIVIACDAAKVKPGLKGNLIVTGYLPRPGSGATSKPAQAGKRFPVGTLPAIPFEVVAKP